MSSQLVKNPLELTFENSDVIQQFEKVLGGNANSFIATVLNIYKNPALMKCDPDSIKNAALISATLNLSVDPSLGTSYIVPYGGKAQFQIGYKGLIELGHRSGLYKRMNVTDVKEGEYGGIDRRTGEMNFNWIQDNDKRNQLKTIGYVGHFSLHNGFEKDLFMTEAELEKHGLKFSKSYNHVSSQWKNDGGVEMKKKTVLKLLIGKFGPKSVKDLNLAIQNDQMVFDSNGKGNYADNPSEPIDLETHNKEVARNQQLHFIETQTDISILQTVENHIEDQDIMAKYKSKMDQLLKQQSNG